MGEYSETFTVDGFASEVREICLRYMRGFGYRVAREKNGAVILEKGSLRKNFFTFSFDEAYKQVVLAIVGSDSAPVCTVSVSFSLPFLSLRRTDISAIRSTVKSLKEFVVITLSHESDVARR